MSDIPPQQSPHPGMSPAKPVQSDGNSNALVIIIVVLAAGAFISLSTCGIAAAILLPAIQLAKEVSGRAQSSNNLKQIGLAMHGYHEANGTFPPAYTVDEDGNRLHSWRTLILPYIEQQNLYDLFALDEPWDSQANQFPANTPLRIFQSPRQTNDGSALTNYVLVTCDPKEEHIRAWRTLFAGEKAPQIPLIVDGSSKTILVIEVFNSDIRWAEPRDLEIDELRRVEEGADPDEPNVIPRRAIVLVADGSVHMTSDTVDAETFRKFLSPAGSEPVDWPEE